MEIVEEQIAEFKGAVASIPKMTTVLNRSKRAMINVIGQLVDEFRSARVMAREAETSFEAILEAD
jgi:hypothetical protein